MGLLDNFKPQEENSYRIIKETEIPEEELALINATAQDEIDSERISSEQAGYNPFAEEDNEPVYLHIARVVVNDVLNAQIVTDDRTVLMDIDEPKAYNHICEQRPHRGFESELVDMLRKAIGDAEEKCKNTDQSTGSLDIRWVISRRH